MRFSAITTACWLIRKRLAYIFQCTYTNLSSLKGKKTAIKKEMRRFIIGAMLEEGRGFVFVPVKNLLSYTRW
jgi:hypothetical protein